MVVTTVVIIQARLIHKRTQKAKQYRTHKSKCTGIQTQPLANVPPITSRDLIYGVDR